LRALGCEYGQGFLFSEPLTAEGTEELLTAWPVMQSRQPATA
jgi:EAL domain-containing protein (putative c-di-GMP-specific phosphodiesterase class I)